MRYFDRFRSAASITKRYRELAKLHHPDVGGSGAVMADINSQYEEALRRIAASQARGEAQKTKAGKDKARAQKSQPSANTGHSFSEPNPKMDGSTMRYDPTVTKEEKMAANDLEVAAATFVRAASRLVGEVAVNIVTAKLQDILRR